MKKLIHITAILLTGCTIGWSQTQLNNWYMGPHKVNMTVTTPIPSTITPAIGNTAAATAVQSANGFYDNNGTGALIFYVADGGVYDYNNTFIGGIPNGATEIAIVPFGTNSTIPCQRKYNIFTTSGGFTTSVGLFQSVLDMNSYSVSTTEIDSMPFGNEFGAIAVGKANASGDRYLYFLVGSGSNGPSGQINKLTIYNNGTVSASTPLYPTATLPNNKSGMEVFARELDLSADGKWMAWSSYNTSSGSSSSAKYHFLALDNSTGYVNTATYGSAAYQQFNIAAATDNYATPGFRGVEFYQSGATTRLFMGAGLSGIYYVVITTSTPNISISNPILVSGSAGTTTNTYGLSQIELAHSNNAFMYASSGNASYNIGALNPSIGTPQILNFNSFYMPAPPAATYVALPNPTSFFYTLPDQIDGQDYSLITPVAVPQVATTGTYIFGQSGPQTATWMYGGAANNPWSTSSPVQVVKELRIKNNSHLTISGMTFKFSPAAKVIIEPGSTLTLDTTLFTSDYMQHSCDVAYAWVGVEVWGNSNLSQNTLPLQMGKLTLQNNSMIEHAQWGARAQNPADSAQRGGIIIATTGANFKNCKVGVEFKEYHNIYNGTEYGNKSYFSGVTFSNNTDYLNNFTVAPQHASIEGCMGIRFPLIYYYFGYSKTCSLLCKQL